MTEAEKFMAENCYGYGRWDAPYWFIGPEQGMKDGTPDELAKRYEAFRDLSKDGLCDCRAFHEAIGETRWHRQDPELQKTWKFLILLLMTFLDKPADDESRKAYQRDCWGRLKGETCVIELSGIPAKSFNHKVQRELFREKRLKFIRAKILEHRPKFAVMYSTMQKEYFSVVACIPLHDGSVEKVGSTVFVLMQSPTVPRTTRQKWIDLGVRLRTLVH